jgi:hypothetical protein
MSSDRYGIYLTPQAAAAEIARPESKDEVSRRGEELALKEQENAGRKEDTDRVTSVAPAADAPYRIIQAQNPRKEEQQKAEPLEFERFILLVNCQAHGSSGGGISS